MIKKILLTGGAGFIGSHTAKALIKKGNRVVIVDNFSRLDGYLINLKRSQLLVKNKSVFSYQQIDHNH